MKERTLRMKFLVKLLALVLATFLVACDRTPARPTYEDISSSYSFPEDMGPCKVVYARTGASWANLYVAKCGGTTSTNYFHGKGHNTITIMVDGVEYEAKKKETEKK